MSGITASHRDNRDNSIYTGAFWLFNPADQSELYLFLLDCQLWNKIQYWFKACSKTQVETIL